jgi:hypothetical protein
MFSFFLKKIEQHLWFFFIQFLRAAFFFLVNFVVNGLDEYGKNVLDLVHFFGFPA